MNTEQDKAALEEIAESWDGCMYDDVGQSIDIGENLRKQFAALQSAVTPAANAGGQPIAYVRTKELEKLASPLVAGVGMMLHKERDDGMVALYDGPTAASAAANAGGQDVDLLPPLGIRNDRDMLNYLAQAFDNEMSVCDVCHYSETTATCDSARFLRDYLAAATPQQTDEDISCDQCIELAEALVWEAVRQAIAGTRAAASLLEDAQFRGGMETACEEIEARLKLGAAAATPAQDERINELEEENAKLREALADKVSAATMLREISIKDGGINMALEGGASQVLAAAFADQFREKGGANYLEIGFTTPDGLNLLVTLQNVNGKTPGRLKAEADARIVELEAALSQQDSKDAEACEWHFDGDDYCWQTGCGQAWHFPEGGTPAEHSMNFCHHCGKTIAALRQQSVQSDKREG
jgi:hypothetical protein